MVLEPEKPQSLFFRGEVVEICEQEGHRLTKIKLDSHDILDVAAESLDDAHLGDRVVIDATITIKGITSH